MFNPNYLHDSDTRMHELRRLADQRRLANTATWRVRTTPVWVQHLFSALGRQLVQTGQKLLAHGNADAGIAPTWEHIGRVAS